MITKHALDDLMQSHQWTVEETQDGCWIAQLCYDGCRYTEDAFSKETQIQSPHHVTLQQSHQVVIKPADVLYPVVILTQTFYERRANGANR